MPKNYRETKTARYEVGGKCMNCTKPPRPEKMYCQECSDKKAKKDRERYKKRRLERLNYEAKRLADTGEHPENKLHPGIISHNTELHKEKEPGHFGENRGVDMGPSGEQVRGAVEL